MPGAPQSTRTRSTEGSKMAAQSSALGVARMPQGSSKSPTASSTWEVDRFISVLAMADPRLQAEVERGAEDASTLWTSGMLKVRRLTASH